MRIKRFGPPLSYPELVVAIDRFAASSDCCSLLSDVCRILDISVRAATKHWVLKTHPRLSHSVISKIVKIPNISVLLCVPS